MTLVTIRLATGSVDARHAQVPTVDLDVNVNIGAERCEADGCIWKPLVERRRGERFGIAPSVLITWDGEVPHVAEGSWPVAELAGGLCRQCFDCAGLGGVCVRATCACHADAEP